jgi:hypothetical protein
LDTSGLGLPFLNGYRILADQIRSAVNISATAVAGQMLKGQGFVAWLLGTELNLFLKFKGKSMLKDRITKQLQENESMSGAAGSDEDYDPVLPNAG